MSASAFERYWSAPLTLDRHVEAIEKVYGEALAAARGAAAA
jgi:hypothetical protein